MLTRIGILGGMGPEATLYFLRLLYRTLAQVLHPRQDQDYPDVSVMMENTIPDRTRSILERSEEASHRINRAIANLILTGCDPVAIACISAHALVEQRWFDAGVIDFRRSIIDQYDTHHSSVIGVITTDGALVSGLFSSLQDRFELIYPSNSMQKTVMTTIYGEQGLKDHHFNSDEVRSALETVIKDLHTRGADHILTGCTEVEMFVGKAGIEGDFILPMQLMVNEISDLVKSEVIRN